MSQKNVILSAIVIFLSASSGISDDNKHCYYAGPPASEASTIIENTGFTVGYSEDHKNPVWVAYRLFEVNNRPVGCKSSPDLICIQCERSDITWYRGHGIVDLLTMADLLL